eukprot:Skav203839  [mRNA]  locus=scaffold4932:150181:151443:- [translate_table: standard]
MAGTRGAGRLVVGQALLPFKPYLFGDDLYVDDGRFIDGNFPPLDASLGQAKPGRLFITEDATIAGAGGDH